MAAYWDKSWDNEEWLQKQNSATLHYIYETAKKENRNIAPVQAILNQRLEKIEKTKNFNEINVFSSLAYVKFMKAEETAATKVVYDECRKGFSIVVGKRLEEYKESESYKKHNRFEYYIDDWKVKVLEMTSKLLGRTEKADVQAMIDQNEIDKSLENCGKKDNYIGSIDYNNFVAADQVGAFENVTASRAIFLNRVARISGFERAEANDRALDNCVLPGNATLEVFNATGQLNPLYDGCNELAQKIKFEFPAGTDAAKEAELTKAYQQQLLANAAQRASQAILQDRTFLIKNTTEEAILDAYKENIANQFERSVILAGLAGDEATGVMLNEIVRDNNGNIVYKGSNAQVGAAIADILDGNKKINPLAVGLDTYMLDQETKELGKELKLKVANVNKLSFWAKSKKFVAAARENIIKKGGWKKVAANVAVFGSSAFMVASGAGALIVGGAALYAGWTAANAWAMPVYDSLNNEMYSNKIKGLSNRIAYLKANWKRARGEKLAEKGFKNRAWFRTAEGLAVGGITGGLAVGAAGSWMRSLARQSVMATGKTTSMIKSWFGVKKAKKELQQKYTIANYKSLQTVEGYLKQDKVALGAVVLGSLAADYVKYDIENNGPLVSLASRVSHQVEEVNAPIVKTEVKPELENDLKADTLQVKPELEADTLQVKPKPETVIEAKPEATVETVLATTPKPGDTLSTDTLAGGVVRTITKGNGHDFVQYSGLPKGESQTSEVFQKFLEQRINKMNEYNKLIEVFDGKGELVPMDKATEVMLGRLKDGTINIPQGMTAEHALYVAYMKAHYYGDKTMLNLIACSEGVRANAIVSQLSKDAALFNTTAIKGVPFGQPTDGMKCIMRAGTVKTILCEEKTIEVTRAATPLVSTSDPQVTTPTEIDASVVAGSGVEGFAAVTDQPVATEIAVNFKNPYAVASHVYASSGTNYQVGLDLPKDAEYIRMDNKGMLHIWQPKGAELENSGVLSGANGVETVRPLALNINMENLGAANINDTADALSFRYGSGRKALSFVLDKKSGEMHTYIGKKEVILDQAATQKAQSALTQAMADGKLDQRYRLNFGPESEQNNAHLAALEERFKARKASLETAYSEDIAKAAKKGVSQTIVDSSETAPLVATTMNPIGISSDQQAALLSDQANISYSGINEKGYLFKVEGVDGVNQLQLPKMYKSYLSENPEVEFKTAGEEGNSVMNVVISTLDGKKLTVAIANNSGQAAVMIDDKEVMLHPESLKQVTEITSNTLQEQGMNVKNLNLTPYGKGSVGEKLMGIYQKTVAAQAPKAKGR